METYKLEDIKKYGRKLVTNLRGRGVSPVMLWYPAGIHPLDSESEITIEDRIIAGNNYRVISLGESSPIEVRVDQVREFSQLLLRTDNILSGFRAIAKPDKFGNIPQSIIFETRDLSKAMRKLEEISLS